VARVRSCTARGGKSVVERACWKLHEPPDLFKSPKGTTVISIMGLMGLCTSGPTSSMVGRRCVDLRLTPGMDLRGQVGGERVHARVGHGFPDGLVVVVRGSAPHPDRHHLTARAKPLHLCFIKYKV